jgi:peptidoglycan hydrolase-like protein with peptidoglycan-binding domain
VDGYRVTATQVGGAPVTRDSTSSPLNLTGVTNGTSYDVTVAAHNAVGWGPPSPLTRVTLAPGVPVPAYPLVRQGDVSLSGVRTVQFLLRSNPSPRFVIAADGVFGLRTEQAVHLFQTVKGLVVDGIVGQVTWRTLVVTQRFGSRGEQVRAIQALLNIYGRAHANYRLAEDGIFGSLTRAAVIRFQQAVHITDDGLVGPVTWPFLVREAMHAETSH